MSHGTTSLIQTVSDPAMAVVAEGYADLEDGALRMLEVDNRLIIPQLTHVIFVCLLLLIYGNYIQTCLLGLNSSVSLGY